MRTVEWDPVGPSVKLIDQRVLPTELRYLSLHTADEVAQAIQDMVVRGAPAIGATAAFGYALAGATSSAESFNELKADLQTASGILQDSRPTAINLMWALTRMNDTFENLQELDLDQIRIKLVELASQIADEDVEVNKKMGRIGADLIQDGDTILHHCNTGALATVDYGTALGVIRTAHEQGKKIHVLVNETRPRLQGARLTAWELDQYGISYDIIVDSAAGYYLSTRTVAGVFVGADRVAANGDVVNKIGTYMLALATKDNEVPFYAVVPTSTIDLEIESGMEIPIEQRTPTEVTEIIRDGQRITPQWSSAKNPAFDCTPSSLITGWVTEVGLLRDPFNSSLVEALKEASEP